MDLSSYSDDQLQQMLQAAPAAPVAAPRPDLSGLSDEQLQHMLTIHAGPAGTTAGAVTGDTKDYGNLDAIVGGLASGIPFADRAAAALRTGVGAVGLGSYVGDKGSYSGNLDQIRAEQDNRSANHPLDYYGAGIASGATMPLRAAGAVVQGASLGGKILRGAGVGAGIGSLYGASASPDLTNAGQTAASTGVGAIAGGIMGGAVPAVGAGAGAAYRGVYGQAVPAISGMGNRAARNILLDAIAKDGAEAVAAKQAAYGSPGMLMDYGPGLQGIGQGLATKDGAAAATVTNALGLRQAATNDRVRQGLVENFGLAQDPAAVSQTISDTRNAITGPLYDQSFQGGQQHWTPELAALTQRPAVAGALRDASTVAANQGRPLPTVTLNQAGQPVSSQAPIAAFEAAQRPAVDQAVAGLLGSDGSLAAANRIVQERQVAAGPLYDAARAATIPDDAMPVDLLRRLQASGAMSQAQQKMRVSGEPFDIGRVTSWDYMKRALDDRIGAAQRKGANDDARIFTGLKNELTTSIDAAVPEYGQARQAFAGHSEFLDAIRAGQQAMGNGVSREQVAADYAALGTDGERHMYRLGAANALRERLAQRGDNANFVDAVAGNQALRDKLSVMAPHPQAMAQFDGAMNTARQTFTEAQRPTVQGWKHALDVLDTKAGQGGDAQDGVIAARDALAGQLNQIQPFGRARQIEQQYAGLDNAIGYGRQSLSAAEPIWPGAYGDRLGVMTPAEQAANRIGQRSVMEEAIGTKPNDQLAIKQLFQTGNTPGYLAPGVTPGNPDLSGWNAQKISTAYGHQPVARMQELLNANDAFNDTFNKVAQNSQTARRTAMSKALEDAEWKPKDILPGRATDATLTGLGLHAAKGVVNALAKALQSPISNVGRDAELATVATATGARRQQILADALKALPAREANKLVGMPLEQALTYAGTKVSPAALAAALRAYQPQNRR